MNSFLLLIDKGCVTSGKNYYKSRNEKKDLNKLMRP